MDAVTDPSVREIWVMKSAQVGWTEILNNVVGYHIDQDPSPMLVVQPTIEMGEAYSKDRIAPMIRDTPCLTKRIAPARARDSGNTLLHKTFAGGHLTIAGANAPAGLASRPIRVVLFDEVDRFPATAGTEGDPIKLGQKRTTTFWNRIVLAGSTPTIKGSSRIEAGFDGSDQRYYFVPCPHCDEFQRLVWAQVHWREGRPETAVYACKHCGAEITDFDKPEMLRRGEWRASKPSSGIAGFHISELYSPWVTWAEMARAFLEAKQLPETLQTWINTSLGETWEDKGDSVEATGLLTRRELYGPQMLPEGVLLLTVGVDVQDNRLEAQLVGWGVGEESWSIETKVLRGDPGSPQLWTELDEYISRRYATADGRTLWCEAAAVDSGGHFTQQVYEYCRKRKRWRVWAIKGQGGAGRLVWPKKASKGKTGTDVFIVGVDTIKDLLYNRLAKILVPGPGYLHFPQAADEDYFEQLTSETKVYKQVLGRRTSRWRPKKAGIAQEAQDTWLYAYAAMIGRDTDLTARATAVASAPRQAPVPARTPTRRRGSRSGGVRI